MIVRDVVAIVDDEPLVLRALQRILGPAEREVVTASAADQIDTLIADPRLAVVLLDLFMDGATGPERIDRIRRARPDVAVVVMTGRPSVDSAVECIRAGAFDYLCKPFTNIAHVRDVVGAARAHAQAMAGAGEARRVIPAPPRPTGVGSDWVRVPLLAEPVGLAAAVPLSLDAYERLALERALREAAGDAAEAARRLGIGRSTFYRKAAKHGVDLRRADGPGAPSGARPARGPGERVGEGPAIG